MAEDKIARAVNAERAKKAAAELPAEVPVQLSSGRVAVVVVPKDITSVEVLDLVAYITHTGGLARKLGEIAKPGPQLVVASSLPRANN